MPALETLFLIGLITSIAANIAVVVFIAFLAIKEVVKWFRNRSRIKQQDKDNIAFTLQEKIGKNQYKTVQGVFNTRTNDLKEGRIINSDKVDSEIKNIHKDNELIIYE